MLFSQQLNDAITRSLGQRGKRSYRDPIVVPRERKAPLSIVVRPLSPATNGQGGAIVMIYQPEKHPKPSKEIMKKLFNLTNAEVELCIGLAEGLSIEELAEQQAKSANTLRGYLKALFNKTGTKRQAELVATVLSSPAYLLNGIDKNA